MEPLEALGVMGTKEQIKNWTAEQDAIDATLTNHFEFDVDKHEKIYVLDMKIKGIRLNSRFITDLILVHS